MKKKMFILTLIMAFLTASTAYSLGITPRVLINNTEVNAIVYNDEIYIPLSAVKLLGANTIQTNEAILVNKQPTDLKTAYDIMDKLDKKLKQRISEYTQNISKAGTKTNLEQLALTAAKQTGLDMAEIENIVPGNFYVLLAKNSLHAMYNQAFSSFMQQADAVAGSKSARELVERYQQSKAIGFEISELSFRAAMNMIEKQLQQEGKLQGQRN